MSDSRTGSSSLGMRIFFGIIGTVAGAAAAIAYFFVSTLIYDADPFGFGFVDMLPAALIGFGIFLPVILVPFFLIRKRCGLLAGAYLTSGLILMIIVLIFLGSIKFYY